MKQRQLLYLGGGFVLLLLVWLMFIRDSNPSTIGTIPTVEIPTDQVHRLTVEFPADTVVAERQGARWILVRPVSAIADSNTVIRLVQDLANLELDAPVTSDVERHAYYGFDSTASNILAEWGGESFAVTVSRQGPDYTSVYVRLEDDDRIYSTRQRLTVQQSTDRWRDRRIMSLNTATVQAAVVSRPEGSYEITRTDTGWALNAQEADSMSVENWLRRFSVFNADGFMDDIPRQVLQDASYQINFSYTSGSTDHIYLMQAEGGLALSVTSQEPTYRLIESRLDTYFPEASTFNPE